MQFEFTEKEIEKINVLNQKCKTEEERIFKFANQLRPNLQQLVDNNTIDDYNFNTRLLVCSDEIDEDDAIWIDPNFPLFGEDVDPCFYIDNWNDLIGREHPLSDCWFCYTMHCIAFHSKLTWQEIIKIDDIWYELKVDYQFFTTKNTLQNEE